MGEGGRQSETQAALLPTTRGLFVKPNNWAPIAQDGVDFCRMVPTPFATKLGFVLSPEL